MSLLDYIEGKRKGKDAHRLEKDAMTDPFLSDALEGFDSVRENHLKWISRMQTQVIKKAGKRSNRIMSWSVAAGILFCIGLGGYFLNRYNAGSSGDLYSKVGEKEKIKTPVPITTEKIEKDLRTLQKVEEQELVFSRSKEKKIGEIVDQKVEISDKPIKMKQTEAFENGSMSEAQDLKLLPVKTPVDSDDFSALADVMVTNENLVEEKVIAKNYSKFVLQGRIVDNTGEPLTGVSIIQKKTGTGAVSDLEGNFKLETSNIKEPFIAQYIGFESKEVPIDTGKLMFIAMNENDEVLDEVVVIGYKSEAKKDITGSIMQMNKMRAEGNNRLEPIVGMSAYKKYLKENLNRPDDPDCNKIKGKVCLSFYIDDSGRPYNIHIKKSLCPALDNEAIRLISEGPVWKTGDREVILQVKFK